MVDRRTAKTSPESDFFAMPSTMFTLFTRSKQLAKNYGFHYDKNVYKTAKQNPVAACKQNESDVLRSHYNNRLVSRDAVAKRLCPIVKESVTKRGASLR